MGTVFTLDVRDRGRWDGAVADVVAWLHHVDAVFSTYRAGSDISRIRRGELGAADADPDVLPVLALAAEIEAETDGWFTVFPDGELDPTGLVKGWAIERASAILRDHGSRNHAVNGGGDVDVAGEAAPGRPWTVGVADPHDRRSVLVTLTGRDFAVATSGVAERGAHIVDPHAGVPARALAGVTVVGRSLARVDAYATAAFARGAGARAWIDGLAGYEALVVDAEGETTVTSGFLSSPARA
jgi:thiamine biosynthesis lipoprotein